MRIRLKTRYASPSGCHEAGSEVTLSDIEAQELIDAGFAVEIATDRPRAPETNGNSTVSPDPSNTQTPPNPTGDNTVLALLGVPDKAIAALSEQGVITVEHLAEFARTNDLQELPDIGKATARKIIAALPADSEEDDSPPAGDEEPEDQNEQGPDTDTDETTA